MDLKSNSNTTRITIAVLLLVIVVLGAVAIYYSPLLQNQGNRQVDPVAIYAKANDSVVTVQGLALDTTVFPPAIGSVLGTGFVVTYQNSYYIVTNFHVVDGLMNATVTFSNGDEYPAQVVGTDVYSDLGIVSVKAPQSEFHPLQLGVSSTVQVGESVVAIGSPYGLSGTITEGIVSQVGRSLEEDLQGQGGFQTADTIQFSAPINPGNSGGPLLDAAGMVVGITTATYVGSEGLGSEGLGFAIPSDTISRELPSIVENGKYTGHAYLGLGLTDMNLQLGQAMGTNVTWGALIETVVPGGPASAAGLRAGTHNATIEEQQYIIGGDIIISLNGHKIINSDGLSSWMERNATPGQTIQVGIIRSGVQMVISVQVGTRPAPTTG